MEENKTELGYCYKYPRPAVTTDVVLFAMVDSQMKVLLIQRGRDPYKGQWAFPGGFLNMDETAEVGALRELKEETGLELDHVRQFHTFTRLDRDPRGRTISIAYYELIDCQKVVGGDDAACARGFPSTIFRLWLSTTPICWRRPAVPWLASRSWRSWASSDAVLTDRGISKSRTY